MTVETPSLDEKRAIARLKQGDLDGMETLVRRYQVQAVYTAYLIVRDLNLAEDVVQAAFINAAEKIAQFDERRPFKAWFLRSVINASIKAAERQKRLTPLDDDTEEQIAPADWLTDPAPGPAELAEAEDTRRVVWAAMGQLTPEQRAAVVMRHFLDMNEAQMTGALDRPLSTIRWRLRAARSKLKHILGPFWQADQAGLEEGKHE